MAKTGTGDQALNVFAAGVASDRVAQGQQYRDVRLRDGRSLLRHADRLRARAYAARMISQALTVQMMKSLAPALKSLLATVTTTLASAAERSDDRVSNIRSAFAMPTGH